MEFLKDLFGRRITKNEADVYFNRFLEIKRESVEDIKELLQDRPISQRYYSGRLTAPNPVNEDWAFFFDKKIIKDLIDALETAQAQLGVAEGGLVIFNGARDVEPNTPPPDGIAESEGRPTLLLFPVLYLDEKRGGPGFQVLNDQGSEHPGTGTGKGGRLEPGSPSTEGVPDIFEPGTVYINLVTSK